MRLAPAVRVRPLLFAALFSLGFALLATRPASGQSSATPPKSNQRPTPPQPPAVDQEQAIAYWTTETGWHSELQLRNNLSAEDLTVTPALRSAGGTETAFAPVTIKPQEVKSIDIATAIPATAPQLIGTYGSIILRYRSVGSNTLYAALMLHNLGHSIAFHIDATAQIDKYDAAAREGIWWLPNDEADGYLILANQSKSALQLALSLYDASGKESSQNVLVGPNQTIRYSMRKLVQTAGLTGSYGGIKVYAPAYAGSLETLHFIFDQKVGFSAFLKMFDHDPDAKIQERDFAQTSVWTLRAPMLALAHPDRALAFPVDVTLQPQLLLRNTTGKPVSASLRFSWRGRSTNGKAQGPALQLLPHETRRIDVTALQDGKTLPKDARWTSVTLTTNSNPDELMAIAASYDSTLQYGAQTPFSDQLSFAWEGGQWEYDPQHNSLITAGNGGTKTAQAAFTIFYNQGTQRYDLEQTLQPDDQMWIDVGKLIREHVPDKNGRVLPADLSSGSYEFRDLTDPVGGTLFEGKVIYEKTYGHVTYGCAQCCPITDLYLTYNPLGIAFQGTAPNGVGGYNCNGTGVNVSSYFNFHWSTANATIATVDAYATHTGDGVGSTTSTTYGYLPTPVGLKCPSQMQTVTGNDNVTPTITVSCTPTDLALGSGPPDTTSGSCTTQVNPSGGAFSWSVNKSTVTLSATSGASISYNSNSASGSQGDTTISVTYTANGQSATAQSSPITTHNPTSLTVLSDTTNPTAESCSVPCLLNPGDGTCHANTLTCSYNSYLRTRQYSVVDQLNQQFANVGISKANVTESLPTSTSCPNLTFNAHSAPTSTFLDDFYLCHTCCLPSGPGCTMQSAPTQVISVNGFQVRSEAINWTCTSVSLTP